MQIKQTETNWKNPKMFKKYKKKKAYLILTIY